MPRKTFKENTAHLDRFFSDNEPEPETAIDQTQNTPVTDETYEKQQTYYTHRTQETYSTQETQQAQKAYYRINLKLRPEFRQYLDDESWKARKSITEYLNDLIAADMAAKQREPGF